MYVALRSALGTRLLNGFQRKGRYFKAVDRASKPSVKRMVFGGKKMVKKLKNGFKNAFENAFAFSETQQGFTFIEVKKW